jgi:allantoin racemase
MRKKIKIAYPRGILAGWMPGTPKPKTKPTTSYNDVKEPDTEIVHIEVPDPLGPHSMQWFERDLCAIPYARGCYEADQEGTFDAAIIGCYDDPGVEAARELCDILVMSAACASMHVASMLGRKFSIIICGRGHHETLLMDNVRKYGLESRLASIRTMDQPPTGMNKNLLSEEELNKMQEKALDLAKKAIEEDGADTIIAYAGTYEYLKENLDVPVISPGICALKITEALVRMDLTHSKKAFAKPIYPLKFYLNPEPPSD